MSSLSVFKAIKSKLLVLSMRLEILLVDSISCVRLIAFDFTSGLTFFDEAIFLLSSRFVFKPMSFDCSVDRTFRSVFKSWPYLGFDLKSFARTFLTKSFRNFSLLLLLLLGVYLTKPGVLILTGRKF